MGRIVELNLSEEEYQQLVEEAEQAGQSVEEWARKMISSTTKRKSTPQPIELSVNERAKAWKRSLSALARIQKQMGERKFSDSAEIIREFREGDERDSC